MSDLKETQDLLAENMKELSARRDEMSRLSVGLLQRIQGRHDWVVPSAVDTALNYIDRLLLAVKEREELLTELETLKGRHESLRSRADEEIGELRDEVERLKPQADAKNDLRSELHKASIQIEAMRPVVDSALDLVRFLPTSAEFAESSKRLIDAINAYANPRSQEQQNDHSPKVCRRHAEKEPCFPCSEE